MSEEMMATPYPRAVKVTASPDGGANVIAPEDYMKSETYQRAMDEIARQTHILLPGFPPGTPAAQMIEIILNVEYQAFLQGLVNLDPAQYVRLMDKVIARQVGTN